MSFSLQNQQTSPDRDKPLPLPAHGRELWTVMLPRVMEGPDEQHMNSETGFYLSIFPSFYKKHWLKYIVRLSWMSAGLGCGPYFPSFPLFFFFFNPVIFIPKWFNQTPKCNSNFLFHMDISAQSLVKLPTTCRKKQKGRDLLTFLHISALKMDNIFCSTNMLNEMHVSFIT